MDGLEQLEACGNELSAALKILSDYFHSPSYNLLNSTSDLPIPSNAPDNIHCARRNAMRSINRLQFLLTDPEDLIQRLACQSQFVSCLRWLGEFQILAFIPLTGTVSTKDVADLVGVDEAQLSGVVRMTATAGFLYEPQSGFISHTALSSPFVTQLFYLDAVMFLAETVAPAALHMANITKLYGQHDADRPGPSDTISMNTNAYNLAFNTTQTFESVYEQRPKLQRQWPAFLRCTGDKDDSVTQVLARLDWPSHGNVRIVDIGAHSTKAAEALARLFPALHFVVQLSEKALNLTTSTEFPARAGIGSRIVVQRRSAGGNQPIRDAAVYMFRILSASAAASLRGSDSAHILSELRAHLAILRECPSAMFLLTFRPVPEPRTVNPDVEALARTRELTRMQLTGRRDTTMAELTAMVNSVDDGVGRLVVVKKLHSGGSATVAVGVRYQVTNSGSDHVNHPSSI